MVRLRDSKISEGLLEFDACMAFLVAQIAKVYLLSLTWKDSA